MNVSNKGLKLFWREKELEAATTVVPSTTNKSEEAELF